MIVKADTHYSVRRGGGWPSVITALICTQCSYSVSRYEVSQPVTSKSGLGRYNRMRARMVRHWHKYHLEV